MAQSDPLTILLTHDAWATRNCLDACAALSDEQFNQPFEMGCGSLHDTLTHILGAKRGWTDMLVGREPRVRLEEGTRTCGELIEMSEGIDREFDEAVRAHPVDGVASAERGGRSYSFMRGGVATHVTTHAMHHRAQCLNMLRQLGVDPLPPVSVLEWMLIVDPVG